MVTINSQELIGLILSFFWPLVRILGLIAIAPPFGNQTVPMQVKVVFGILLALTVSPSIPVPAGIDPLSLSGVMVTAQQMVIGLGLGFVMRLVFAAVELAGTLSAMTMGLGFATFFDPESAGQSSAISQFMVLIVTMLFFSLNIHLVLITALIDSFSTIPVSMSIREGFDLYRLVIWGQEMFITGLRLSLPIVAALLITNVSMGILTRAAPQLNLFGIGFPITIGVGFLMLGMILPYLEAPVAQLFQHGIEAMQSLSKPSGLPTPGLPKH